MFFDKKMSKIPLYSGEISLHNDQKDGLRVESSERHSKSLKECLIAASFTCDAQQNAIPGSRNIHDWGRVGLGGANRGSVRGIGGNTLRRLCRYF